MNLDLNWEKIWSLLFHLMPLALIFHFCLCWMFPSYFYSPHQKEYLNFFGVLFFCIVVLLRDRISKISIAMISAEFREVRKAKEEIFATKQEMRELYKEFMKMSVTIVENSKRWRGWTAVRYPKFLKQVQEACSRSGFAQSECDDIFSATYFWAKFAMIEAVIVEITNTINVVDRGRFQQEWTEIVDELREFKASWLIGFLKLTSMPDERKRELEIEINKLEIGLRSRDNHI